MVEGTDHGKRGIAGLLDVLEFVRRFLLVGALFSHMSGSVTSEAESFLHVFGSLFGSHSVDVHGIRVMGIDVSGCCVTRFLDGMSGSAVSGYDLPNSVPLIVESASVLVPIGNRCGDRVQGVDCLQ